MRGMERQTWDGDMVRITGDNESNRAGGRCLESVAVADLEASPRNARRHRPAQVEQIARSIAAFGFANPVLVDAENRIIAGHGRVAAARSLGLERVPVVRLHLSPEQARALALADNKLALDADWDWSNVAVIAVPKYSSFLPSFVYSNAQLTSSSLSWVNRTVFVQDASFARTEETKNGTIKNTAKPIRLRP